MDIVRLEVKGIIRLEAMGIKDSYYFLLGFRVKQVASWVASKVDNYCRLVIAWALMDY